MSESQGRCWAGLAADNDRRETAKFGLRLLPSQGSTAQQQAEVIEEVTKYC